MLDDAAHDLRRAARLAVSTGDEEFGRHLKRVAHLCDDSDEAPDLADDLLLGGVAISQVEDGLREVERTTKPDTVTHGRARERSPSSRVCDAFTLTAYGRRTLLAPASAFTGARSIERSSQSPRRGGIVPHGAGAVATRCRNRSSPPEPP